MSMALLTGSRQRISRLDGILPVQGGDVVVAESRDRIAALTGRLPARSVGTYLQLLMDVDAEPSWAPAVTERIETVALVAPLLAPEATVVLLADDPADPTHDQRVANGLCLLAEAALITANDVGVRVSVVRDASPKALARAVGLSTPAGMPAPLADLGADREYADWRTDMLSLTSATDITFFGWLNQEGSPRVGILQGSVLSPLVAPPEATIPWADAGSGAQTLGIALIVHTLGDHAVDDGLVALFVKDVIGSLPPTGFELSASEVERWLRRHLGQAPGT